MKKLFRIHFVAIVLCDLLLLVTFRPRYELSSVDFLLFVFLAITGPQYFYSLTPVFTSCHSTLYYITASHLRENYPDFYNKHITFWECL